MVAGALAYYLVNTVLVAAAIALTAGERAWKVWESNFLWTAPSYFVGAGAAVAAVAIWNADRGWLLPLVDRPGLPHVPVLRDLRGPPRARISATTRK